MPAPTPARPKRVLIIDRSADACDVFRTVLERRGLEIFDAPEIRSGLDAIRRFHPQVIVLDLESTSDNASATHQVLRDELAGCDTHIVLLGSLADAGDDGGYLVGKPYRYGPLIRKIEQLVQ